MRADADVDFGLGKAVAPADSQQARFELAASVVGVELSFDGQAEVLRLPQGLIEVPLGNRPT
jgi:hypothetical protein